MEERDKIVEFERYCALCEFSELKEQDDPCWDCLNDPYALNGVPANYEKKG